MRGWGWLLGLLAWLKRSLSEPSRGGGLVADVVRQRADALMLSGTEGLHGRVAGGEGALGVVAGDGA